MEFRWQIYNFTNLGLKSTANSCGRPKSAELSQLVENKELIIVYVRSRMKYGFPMSACMYSTGC